VLRIRSGLDAKGLGRTSVYAPGEHVISGVPIDVVVLALHKQMEAVDAVIDRGPDDRYRRIGEPVAGNLRPTGPGVVA
jgi:hypothetical protein